MEKVSIVIPNFNQAEYLPACFDHCWFQTYPDLELIVVDGGSTDKTKDYLAGMEREISGRRMDPILKLDRMGQIVRKSCRVYHEDTHTVHPKRELKVLSFNRDLGRTGTYNAGFREVTGDYCTYVVGDDLPHPHMIEELVCAIKEAKADFAYSDFNVVSDDNRILRQVRKPDYDFESCFCDWFHLGVSTLHKTSLHDRVGLMDEEFQVANDYEWYLRMAMDGARFQHVPMVLYSVRFHGMESKHEESILLAERARNFLSSGRSRRNPGPPN